MGPQSAFRWCVTALCLSLSLPACKYSKETVPEARSVKSVRVPNQQRLLALAVEEAVESLDFKQITGKTVRVELTGVLPESGDDMLDYLTQQVEAKLARSGVRVLGVAPAAAPRAGGGETTAGISAAAVEAPRPGPLAPVKEVPSWAKPSLAKKAAAPPPPPPEVKPMSASGAAGGREPDYRLLVGVSWGGIDTRDKVRTDEPLLFGQLSLAGGGLLGGSAMIVASDSTFRKGMSGFLMVSAIAGAATWFFVKTPFPHMYTLMGRVRVMVRGIPTGAGTAFSTEGNGTSKIIVDERNPEGYLLDGNRTRVIETETPGVNVQHLQNIQSEGK